VDFSVINQTRLHFEWHEVLLTVSSYLMCWGIVFLAPRVPRLYGRRQSLRAVQTTHKQPTPRVGGLAIFSALALSVILAPSEIAKPYGLFILAAAIVFIVGLAEDLGFGVSPLKRLCAVCLASLVAIWLLGVWMPRADVPVLDAYMSHWIVGVPITLLVTAGIANGFNLIDGVNGLASMTGMVASVALGLIAEQAGYTAMVHLSMFLAAAILGFFLVNYPNGLIFLGDAGAYTIGFVLSWFGIAVLLNAPEASPWAILLTMFWPVADTLLAIYRRTRRNVATMAPDRLHVHQLVMRALEIYVFGRDRRSIANPLSTLLLAPFVIAPPIAGVMFWNQPIMAFLSVLGFAALFFLSYVVAFSLMRASTRKRSSPGLAGNAWLLSPKMTVPEPDQNIHSAAE
jgi:UDP-N-acetylmuramyl pentapeptide phosphotransferase/UDP-N-acetylglucosamine-1-phosphate transferase